MGQYGHTEIVKILEPLSNSHDTPGKNGETPINEAANYGHTEIVKILAPLTDNPNAPVNGSTPSFEAYQRGHTEIVKILKSFQTSRKHNAGSSLAKQNKKF